MRTPLLLAGLLALTACGKKSTDSDTSPTTGPGTTTGTWVTSDTGETGTSTGGSGSGGSGTTETITTYVGDADIDLDAITWTGTESARVLTLGSGTLMCQWTWSATDWASDPAVGTTPEPAAPPCTDADGNDCTFSFAVNMSNGAQTDGDCTSYGFTPDGGAFHYGYAADWMNGATSYGAQFTYYAQTSATSGDWFPAQDLGYGFFSWTPGTGTANQGQLHYEIQKTLLNSYSTP